jgi:hypothetical protein
MGLFKNLFANAPRVITQATVFMLLFAVSITQAKAQFFVEGSVSVDLSGVTTFGTDDRALESSSFRFGVSPKVGYQLNDRMAIGVSADFARQTAGQNSERQFTSTTWGGSIFMRYRLMEINRFSFLIETPVGFRIGSSESRDVDSGEKLSSQSHTGLQINAYPVISYDLSERFTFLVYCNFLNLGFSSGRTRDELTDRKIQTLNHFSFRAGSSSSISVGFAYNF